MAFVQTAGAKFFIGDDASPISYTEVGEVSNINEIGQQFESGSYSALSDRRQREYKTLYSYGPVSIDLAFDEGDSGQGDVETALASDEDFNFRIELANAATSGGNGTRWDFKAKVRTFRPILGGNVDYVRRRLELINVNGLTKTAAT